jgi:hypothetical protein
MGIPFSLLVIAAGAILAFAVTGRSSTVNVPTVGWILIVAGAVGLVLSLVMWDSWAGGGFWARHRGPPPRRYPPR